MAEGKGFELLCQVRGRFLGSAWRHWVEMPRSAVPLAVNVFQLRVLIKILDHPILQIAVSFHRGAVPVDGRGTPHLGFIKAIDGIAADGGKEAAEFFRRFVQVSAFAAFTLWGRHVSLLVHVGQAAV